MCKTSQLWEQSEEKLGTNPFFPDSNWKVDGEERREWGEDNVSS